MIFLKSITKKVLGFCFVFVATSLWYSCSKDIVDPPAPEQKGNYTVNFLIDSGVLFSSAKVPKGGENRGVVAKPFNAPKKEGFNFAGWYTDPSRIRKFFFDSQRIKSDIALYAKWVSVEYDVIFKTFGGTSIDPLKVKKGNLVNLSSSNPEKEFSIFLGWFTDANLTQKFNQNLPIINNLTLYAKWETEVFDVVFYSNGGTPIPKQSVDSGKTAKKSPINPTKDGYVFLGWFKSLNDGASVFDFENNKIIRRTAIYAKWVDKVVRVTYNATDGFFPESKKLFVEERPAGLKATFKVPQKRLRFEFAEWYTDSDFKNEYNFSTLLKNDTTLYAKWIPKTFRVVFKNLNGAREIEPQEVIYGELVIKPSPNPLKSNSEFIGWYTSVSFKEAYNFDTPVTEKKEIYAYFITKRIVTFEPRGGVMTNTEKTQLVTQGSLATPPNKPTRKDYSFAGWVTDNVTLSNIYGFDTPVILSITLYAKWSSSVAKLNTLKLLGIENPNANFQKTSYTATAQGKDIRLTAPNINLKNLKPSFESEGVFSASPKLDEVQDFSNGPVIYSLTSEDGTVTKFNVEISNFSNPEKKITLFQIRANENTRITTTVVGNVKESSNEIEITLPRLIDERTLKVYIETSYGSTTTPPSGSLIDPSRLAYKVTAEDKSSRSYVLAIKRTKSDSKAINAFSFNRSKNKDSKGDDLIPTGNITSSINGTNIAISLPEGSNVRNLVPTISTSAKNINPNADLAQDFTNPVNYQAIAEDGSSQTYSVRVVVPLSKNNKILQFSFRQTDNSSLLSDDYNAIINQENNTINISIPEGVINRGALTPYIVTEKYIRSISPEGPQNYGVSNTYTVTAQDRTTKEYRLSITQLKSEIKRIISFIFEQKNNPSLHKAYTSQIREDKIYVEEMPFGTNISNLKPTISFLGGGTISPLPSERKDFSNPKNPIVYTVTARNSSTKGYTIVMNVLENPSKEISSFILEKSKNPKLAEDIIGRIYGTIIALQVKPNNSLPLVEIEPTIVYSGASISPATNVKTTFNNNGIKTYTVSGSDGSSQEYTVHSFSYALNEAKIVSLWLDPKNNSALTYSLTADINDTSITINDAPKSLTNPGSDGSISIIPSMVFKGKVVRPPSGEAVNFKNGSIVFTVVAFDNTEKKYNLLINNRLSNERSITAFSFEASKNTTITSNIPAKIDDISNKINIIFPFGTNTSNLTPTLEIVGKSYEPIGSQNFGSKDAPTLVEYIVYAEDGISSRTYTVTPRFLPNAESEILAFLLSPNDNTSLSQTVTGIIDFSDNVGTLIKMSLPPGSSKKGLIPTISISSGATVSPVSKTSQDFTNDVRYIVTAENGTSSKTYIVRTTVSLSDSKSITEFKIFPQDNSGKITTEVSGQIAGNNITITVPFETQISDILPRVQISGASYAPTGRVNFLGEDSQPKPVTYTVTAEDGTTRSYTVNIRVLERIRHTISFNTGVNNMTIDRIVVDDGDLFPSKNTTPKREGYSFSGWYTDEANIGNSKYLVDSNTIIKNNLILFAKWTINTYTITFISQGSAPFKINTINFNENIAPPQPPPSKTGYRFTGWFYNQTATKPYTSFGQPVNKDFTLYAGFEKTSFTITFISLGNTYSVQSKKGGKYIIPSEITYSGHTSSWFEDENFSQPFDINTNTVSGNKTLYAKWLSNDNTIGNVTFSYRDNGETKVISPNKISQTGNAIKADVENKYIKSIIINYTLPKGSSASIVSGSVLKLNASQKVGLVISSESGISKNYEITIIPVYLVTLDFSQYRTIVATQQPSPKNVQNNIIQKVKKGDLITSFSLPPLPNGQLFKGYYYDSTGINKFELSTPISQDSYIYVLWERKGLSVTFEAEEGVFSEGQKKYSINVLYGDKINSSNLQKPTRTNYAFLYWKKNNIQFDFNEKITSSITLIPQWGYTVIFNAGIGGLFGSLKTITRTLEINNNGIAEPNPLPTNQNESNGIKLLGWYKDDGSKFNFSLISIRDNTTLTAKWSYTVSFKNDQDVLYTSPAKQEIENGQTISRPTTDPAKANATFENWYTSKTFNTLFDFDTQTISKNTDIFARFSYTITFDPNGGTLDGLSTLNVKDKQEVTKPNDPSKLNSNFKGWFSDAALSNKFIFTGTSTTTVSENITLYAKFLNRFTVSFKNDQDVVYTSPAKQEIENGQTISRPTTDPSKANATFENWYTSNTFTKLFDFKQPISRNTDIFARFSYTITFDPKGGTLDGSKTLNVKDKQEVTKPNDPSKTGFNFKGWFSDAALSNKFIFTGPNTTTVSENITLYAKFLNRYTVSFKNAQDVVYTSPAKQEIENGQIISRPTTDPSKANATFENWYTSNTFTKLFVFNQPISQNTDIFARFSYTITFDPNGGALDGSRTLNVKDKQEVTKPNDPSKTGFNFKGWFSDVALSNKFIFTGLTSTTVSENITLYAKFLERFTVSFKDAQGKALSPASLQNIDDGQTISRPATNPSKANATFENWYTSKTFTQLFDFDTQTISRNTDIFARFSYIITFDPNGGALDGSRTLNVKDKQAVTKPNDPSKTGFNFKGWFSDAALSNKFIFTGPTPTTVSENITLYAKFLNLFTVSFKNDQDVLYTSPASLQNIEDGQTISRPTTDPAKANATFENWYTSKTFTQLFDFKQPISGNTDIFARFSYIITFDPKGGTLDGLRTLNVKDKQTVTKPNDPSKLNSNFKGWFSDAALSNEFIFTGTNTTTVSENITLYAKFLNRFTVSFKNDQDVLYTSPASLQNIEDGQTISRPTTDPAKANATFENWYTSKTFTQLFDFKQPISGNTDIFARFSYIITFDPKGGTLDGLRTLNVKDKQTITKPNDPSKLNSNFKGWFSDAALSNEFIFTGPTPTTVSENITLYAKFLNRFTVSFKNDQDVLYTSPASLQNIEDGQTISRPTTDPAKANATFENWYTSKTFTQLFDFKQPISGNTDIFARFSYIITFDPKGGTLDGLRTLNVKDKQTITKPNDPSKLNSNFKGWFSDAALSNEFIFTGPNTTTVSENITLYAKFLNLFTVSFKNDQDVLYTSPAKQEIENGQTISRPTTDPSKANATFENWYTSNTFTKLFVFNQPISQNTDIFARFSYTITFDPKGGTLDGLRTLNVKDKQAVTKPNDPSKLNSNFKGWFSDAALSNEFIFTGPTPTTVSENITLYAKFLNRFTVSFKNDQDVLYTSPASLQNIEDGQTISRPTTDPAKANATFENWYTSKTFTQLFDFKQPISGNTDIFARFSYIITFDPKGGTLDGLRTLNVKDKQTITKPNDPSKLNSNFKGWFSDAALSNEFIFTGTNTTTVSENITLYAKFLDSFTVSFKNDQDVLYTSPAKQEIEDGQTISRPTTDPAKAKATFENWYTSKTFTQLFDFNQPISQNTDIFARFSYIITFDPNGGTLDGLSTLNVKDKQTVTKPNDPSKLNSNFKGWFSDAALSNEFIFTGTNTTTVSENITLYAKFLNRFTVSFKNDQDVLYNSPAKQEIENGQIISRPTTDPAKANATFENWYTSNTFTKLFVFNQPISQNTDIFARFSYTITFDPKGGTLDGLRTLNVKDKQTVTKPNDPSKLNSNFKGWFSDAALSNEFIFTGTNTTTVSENITLYAKFLNLFTVSFKNDQDVLYTSPAKQEIENGQIISRPTTDPAKANATFENWYTSNTFTKLFVFNQPISQNTDIFARFSYTITFDPKGGTLVGLRTLKVKDKQTVTKPNDPSKLNSNFKGWFSDAALSNEFIFTGTNTTTVSENITLYAKFLNRFTVSFKNDQDVLYTSPAKQEIENGQIISRPTTDPSKAKATFENWYTSKTFTKLFDFDTQTISGNTDIFARFSYIITFDPKGGTLDGLSTLKVKDKQTVTKPNDPSKLNSNFKGWFSDAALSNEFIFTGTNTTTVSENITLYAKFLNLFTVSFKNDQDVLYTSPAKQNIEDGQTISRPTTDPAKANATFENWYTSKTFTQLFDFKQPISGNTDIFARFSYIITFDPKGGTLDGLRTLNVKDKQTITKPNDPSKLNSNFKGWFSDAALSNEFIFTGPTPTTVSENITLYAKFLNLFTVSFKNDQDVLYTSPASLQNIEDGQTISRPTTDPAKANATFENWYTSKTFTQLFDFKQPISGNTDIFARFSYIITFDPKGGTLDGLRTLNVKDKQTITKPNDPSKLNSNFKGWFSDAALSNEFIFTGTNTTTVSENITLYAKFLNLFTVSFKNDQDVLYTSPARQEIENGQTISRPTTDPSKANATFENWYTSNTFTKLFVFNQPISQNTDIFARFSYTITFDPKGGTLDGLSTLNVKDKQTVTKPNDPSKLNSNFKGWFSDAALSNEFIFTGTNTTTVSENITLYAKFLNLFTVSFKNDQDVLYTSPAKQEIENGQIISRPTTDPAKANATFENWYTSNTFTKLFVFNQPISQNTDIFARFSYTITFDPKGGTLVGLRTLNVKDKQTVTKPNDPSKLNSNFKGWFSDAALSNEFIFTGTNTTTVSENITLYAKFLDRFTVSFKNDQDVLYTSPAKQEIENGQIISRPTTDPAKANATFENWYTSNTFTKLFVFNQPISQNTDIFARFSYTITFDPKGGTLDGLRTLNVKDKQTVTKPNDPSKLNSNFKGWFSDAALSNEFIFTGTNTTTVSENITLYAKFLNRFTVSFKNDQDVLYTSPAKQEIENGQIISRPTTDPAKANATFENWYTSNTFTKLFVFNQPISQNTDIFARFSYIITFDPKGGTLDGLRTLNVKDKQTVTKPNDPSKLNSNFKGWFSDAALSNEFIFTGPNTTTVSENITLYAKFLNRFTVSFKNDQDVLYTSPAKQEIENGQIISRPTTDPSKAKATFENWYTSNTFTKLFVFNQPISQNTDIFARFSYIITFDPKGGTLDGLRTLNVKDKQTVTKPNDPSKLNSNFKGWFSDAALSNEFIFTGPNTTTVSENITLYAKFLNRFTVSFKNDQDVLYTSPAKQEIEDGQTISRPTTDPSKANATFENWYTSKTFTQLFEFNQPISGNTDIFARFSYIITFDPKGGTLDGLRTLNVKDKQTITKPNDPSKLNSNFKGWFSDAALSNEFIFTGTNTTTVSENITLYAKFLDLFTVSFKNDQDVLYTSPASLQNIEDGQTISRPTTDPAKANATFENWYTSKTFTQLFDFNQTISGNTDIFARFSYIITFDPKGGTLDGLSTLNVKDKQAVTKPNDPSKLNSNFKGWFSDAALSNEFIFTGPNTTTVSENITLYAKFLNRFTVSFKNDQDVLYTSPASLQNIEDGQTISRPTTDPAKANATFENWYTSKTFTQLFDFKQPISGNTDIFARFSYIITFDPKGGTLDGLRTLNVKDKQTITKPNDPSKLNSNFKGWFSDAALSNEFIFTGPNTTTVSENITLYAKFLNRFTVSFKNDQDVLYTSPAKQEIEDGQTISRPTTDPSKANATFENWYTSKTFTQLFEFNQPISGNTDIFARFSYIITFDPKGGTLDGLRTLNVKDKQTITKPNDPSKLNSNFKGWFSDAALSNEFIFTGTNTTTVSENITLYAKFLDLFTVSFKNDQDVLYTSPASLQNIEDGQTISRPTTDPAKANATFENWYTSKTFTQLFDFNQTISGNTDIFARFSYIITFDPKGGTLDGLSTLNVKDKQAVTKPNDPSKLNSNFKGWFSDAALSNEFIFTGPNTTTVSENITLYAKFLNRFTVSFKNDQDVLYTSPASLQNIEDGQTISRPTTDPAKANATFENWYTSKTFTQLFDFKQPISGNTDIFARFSYIITFDPKGGTLDGLRTLNVKDKQTVTKPNDPSKLNSNFKGWFSDAALSNEFIFTGPNTTTVSENITLYAKFLNLFTVSFKNDQDVLYNSPASLQNIEDGQTISRPTTDPAKANATFENWYTSNTFTQLFDFKQPISGNTDIFARFSYIITFDPKGGTLDGLSTLNVKDKQTVTKPNDPSKLNSNFKGWFSDAALSNEFIFTGPNTTTVSENITLYAKFLNLFTVSFKNDQDVLYTSPARQEIENGQTISRPTTDPSKANATFENWYTSKTFTQLFDFNQTISGNTDIFARFSYIITFDPKGGTLDGSTPLSVKDKQAVTKPNDPTKGSDVFAGWYTDAATTTKYNFSDLVNTSFTLYAKWYSKSDGFVYLDIGNKSVPPASDLSNYGQTVQDALKPYNSGATLTFKHVTTGGTGSSKDGSSWENAIDGSGGGLKTTIDGITDASTSQVYVILIAGGTYAPTSTLSMKDNVAIVGGWKSGGGWTRTSSDVTAINGSSNGNKVIFSNSDRINNTALLYGVTITNGARNSGNSAQTGGMLLSNSSSPTINHVTFSANGGADTTSGAMSITSSSPKISYVTFSGNTGEKAGGIFIIGSTIELNHLTFSGNTSSITEKGAGGLTNFDASIKINYATFSGNTGYAGAITFGNSSFSVNRITHSTFSENRSSNGAILIEQNVRSTIESSIFWNNDPTDSANSIQIKNNT